MSTSAHPKNAVTQTDMFFFYIKANKERETKSFSCKYNTCSTMSIAYLNVIILFMLINPMIQSHQVATPSKGMKNEIKIFRCTKMRKRKFGKKEINMRSLDITKNDGGEIHSIKNKKNKNLFLKVLDILNQQKEKLITSLLQSKPWQAHNYRRDINQFVLVTHIPNQFSVATLLLKDSSHKINSELKTLLKDNIQIWSGT